MKSEYKNRKYSSIKIDLRNKKIKLSRLYEKLRNSRKHNIIKMVNKLVEENDIIISEKLDVVEMLKNHRLAKKMTDVSFAKICEMLR